MSAILNGNTDRFPARTVERVQASAAALNYTPSLAARALVRGNSGTVVILLPNATFGTQVQDLADRLMSDLESTVSNVVVRFFDGNLPKLEKALRMLDPIAVVNFGALPVEAHKQVHDAGFRILPKLDPAASSPGAHDRGIGPLQLSAISDRRSRTIIFAALAEKRTDVFGPQRFAALVSSCEAESLPLPLQVSVDPQQGAWKDELRSLFEECANGRLGIVCYNDDVALAVLAGAQDLGLSVPDQVSIVGMDGTNAGKLWKPRLTSIEMDVHAYADYLASLLIAELGGDTYSASAQSAGSELLQIVPGETTQ